MTVVKIIFFFRKSDFIYITYYLCKGTGQSRICCMVSLESARGPGASKLRAYFLRHAFIVQKNLILSKNWSKITNIFEKMPSALQIRPCASRGATKTLLGGGA